MIFCFLTLIIYIYLSYGGTYVPIEELGIISGIGMDIYNESSESVQYSVPISVYTYNQNAAITNLIHIGKGLTLGSVLEDRQLGFNKKFMIGLEKIVLFSESVATYSLKPRIDVFFTSPNVNDTAYTLVCMGNSEDMLALQVKGYPTSSDYIEGIMNHISDSNFFSQNYKVMDMYVRVDAEGRNLVLPYIEIDKNTPVITGMALFDNDKMLMKIAMGETKYLNLLRENNVRGNLSLQENSNEFIDFHCTSKRKVKCEKINNKYNFTITLSLLGNITDNSMYINLGSNSKVKEQFKEDMAVATERMCMDFITKMQSQYKIDALDLGRVAAATYGRGTGTDWNEVICNSDLTNIDVKVNVEVDNTGRGDY